RRIKLGRRGAPAVRFAHSRPHARAPVSGIAQLQNEFGDPASGMRPPEAVALNLSELGHQSPRRAASWTWIAVERGTAVGSAAAERRSVAGRPRQRRIVRARATAGAVRGGTPSARPYAAAPTQEPGRWH